MAITEIEICFHPIFIPIHLKSKNDLIFSAMILDHFEWNIFIPSPTHYVDILRNKILLSDDIYGGSQLPEVNSRQFTEISDGLTDFIHYFLDISMQVCTIIYRNNPKMFRVLINLCYVFSFLVKRVIFRVIESKNLL